MDDIGDNIPISILEAAPFFYWCLNIRLEFFIYISSVGDSLSCCSSLQANALISIIFLLTSVLSIDWILWCMYGGTLIIVLELWVLILGRILNI